MGTWDLFGPAVRRGLPASRDVPAPGPPSALQEPGQSPGPASPGSLLGEKPAAALRGLQLQHHCWQAPPLGAQSQEERLQKRLQASQRGLALFYLFSERITQS